jgi:hypothetical protein
MTASQSPAVVANKLAERAIMVAIGAACVSIVAAAFGGWQAYEAHEANRQTAAARASADAANQEIIQLQRDQLANQKDQLANQKDQLANQKDQLATEIANAERQKAEAVFLESDILPSSKVADQAGWAVANEGTSPITGVYVTAPGKNGGTTVWGINEVPACTAVALKYSNGWSVQYLHYIDQDGTRWRRLSQVYASDADQANAPQHDPDQPTSVRWSKAQAGGRVALPNCHA